MNVPRLGDILVSALYLRSSTFTQHGELVLLLSLPWYLHSFHRCGPCHMIAPVFENLSKQYKNVNFLKCDVDAAKDVAGRYRISAMCVFHLRILSVRSPNRR